MPAARARCSRASTGAPATCKDVQVYPLFFSGECRERAARALAVDFPHRLLAARSEDSVHLVAASVEDHRPRPQLGSDQSRSDARRSENAGRFRRPHHARSERPGNLRHHLHHRALAQRREHHLDRLRRRPGLHHAATAAKNWKNVTPPGTAGLRAHQPDRSLAAPTRRRPIWPRRIIRTTTASPTSIDRRLRQDLDQDRQRHSGRRFRARGPRRSQAPRPAVLPEPNTASTFRSMTAANGSRCA